LQGVLAVLALADDLTGALEVGAKFAGRGIASRVTTSTNLINDILTVIDMESRCLPPADASRKVTSVARNAADLIYLKTDSTLRGNIAAEMRALASSYPSSRIAYIPAYPALGRIVRNGCLFVDGIPVHKTAFAADPLNPIGDSSIMGMLGNDLPCLVHDGETEADVADAVAAALGDKRYRIIAGPASVAAELAIRLDLPRHPVQRWPKLARCLIVNGSLHPASARQVAHSQANGCASYDVQAPWRILPPVSELDITPAKIAAHTGRTIARVLQAQEMDALMIFGGNTAFHILHELGLPSLEPIGEVITGVPVSRISGERLHFITKAGGFGDKGLICRVKEILNGNT
jgi:D-threonate/D-erythronate kinase